MERLVSASDDFTMYLWEPTTGKKPIKKMIGHAKQVNYVTFSPDALLIASCGFDNHTKLWSARDGTFITTLRGTRYRIDSWVEISISAMFQLLKLLQ